MIFIANMFPNEDRVPELDLSDILRQPVRWGRTGDWVKRRLNDAGQSHAAYGIWTV